MSGSQCAGGRQESLLDRICGWHQTSVEGFKRFVGGTTSVGGTLTVPSCCLKEAIALPSIAPLLWNLLGGCSAMSCSSESVAVWSKLYELTKMATQANVKNKMNKQMKSCQTRVTT